MAELAARTSSVCSQSPYSNFLQLAGWAPAVSFCTYWEANGKQPSISNCPTGNSLCKVLASLSSCQAAEITQGCICIGVTPSTTVSVPKSTAQSSPAKSSAPTWGAPTSSSKTTSSWAPVKSSSNTWTTSTTAANTCPGSTVTVTAAAVTVTLPPVTVTATPTTCAPSATPTCDGGAIPANPPPAGAVCQQNGTISPTNWDLITGGTATSVSACAGQCLNTQGCQSTEYDYATGNCQIFYNTAENLGFVAVAASPFIDTDVNCFVTC